MTEHSLPSAEPEHAFTNRIVKIFLESNLSVILILLAVIVGLAALGLTPREEDPQIVVPLADVYVNFPGHSAAEVEQLVATPLEAMLYGNFLPGWTREQARQWFVEQAGNHPRRSLVKTLGQLVPERFAEGLCLRVECDPQRAVAQLPRENRDRLVAALIKFEFPVARDRGWNYAEVTAGGVPLDEISFRTMESKLVRGLYLVGEILDCDGRIGGFNFQWAWATGFLAGRAAAASL